MNTNQNIEIKNKFLKVIDVIIVFYSLPFIYFVLGITNGIVSGEGMLGGIYFLPFLPLVLIQIVISLMRIRSLDLFDKIFWVYSFANLILFFLYLL